MAGADTISSRLQTRAGQPKLVKQVRDAVVAQSARLDPEHVQHKYHRHG